MRVLAAHKYYWPKAGAETYLFALERLLTAAGHEVVPFAMAHPANLPTPWAKHFVSQVEFRGRRNWWDDVGRAARVVYSNEARKRMDALLREAPPQVAHLHNIAHQLSPSILDALAAHRVPVVQTMHDYKLLCPVYTFRSQGETCERCKGGRYWHVVERRCNADSLPLSATNMVEAYVHAFRRTYDRVHVFHCPSLFVLAKMLEFGVPRERLAFVPHFVDAAAFTPAFGGGHYAFFAGRLAEEKGVDVLLRAHAQVPGLELVIAGEGPLRAALEASLTGEQRGRVRFAGHLTGDAFDEAWAGASCLVLPSTWYEVRPMVIHEAYARGKPVVSSRLGSIPEIVEDGITGRLVPPGDTRALGEAMRELVDDGPRAEAMGRAGRDLVETVYGPARHLEAMLGLYAQAEARRAA
ncbi:MAG: glycosyltransferase family 4 protein [Candidatus Eisenbacteria bacterium]